MESRRLTRVFRLGALLSIAALLLMFVTACGGDDDDTDATSTTGSSSSTATVSGSGSTTATAGTTDEATPTTDAAGGVTATIAGTDPSTPTSAAGTDATATTAEDDATATSDGSASTPDVSEDPLAEFETLDPEELPNFSLDATIEIANVDETTGETTIVMEIRQADVDNYHMKIDSGDEGGLIETWRVGDRSWTATAGVIEEDPTGMGSFFSPALFLQQLPNLAEEMNLEKIGEEEVSGRETTHYRGSAEEILKLMQEDSETDFLLGATDPEGQADIWIDNELKIMIRARMDVSWTNSNGTTGLITEDYDIFDIGDTLLIEAPQ